MFAVVGGIKGGAGKTIMATNLAVLRAAAGREVLLFDGDDQESTTLWSATRNEVLGARNRITAIQLTGRGTRDELQRLLDARLDDGTRLNPRRPLQADRPAPWRTPATPETPRRMRAD